MAAAVERSTAREAATGKRIVVCRVMVEVLLFTHTRLFLENTGLLIVSSSGVRLYGIHSTLISMYRACDQLSE